LNVRGSNRHSNTKINYFNFPRKKKLQDEDIKLLLEHKTEMKLGANCSNSQNKKLRDFGGYIPVFFWKSVKKWADKSHTNRNKYLILIQGQTLKTGGSQEEPKKCKYNMKCFKAWLWRIHRKDTKARVLCLPAESGA